MPPPPPPPQAWPQLSAPPVLAPPSSALPAANASWRKPAPPPKPERAAPVKTESFVADPSKTFPLAGKRPQHELLAGLTPHMMSYASVYPGIVQWQERPIRRDDYNWKWEEDRLQAVYKFVHSSPQPWRDDYGLVTVPDPDGTFREGFHVLVSWERFQANRSGMDPEYGNISDCTMQRIVEAFKEHNKYKQVFQHVYKAYEPVMQTFKEHGAFVHLGWAVDGGANYYSALALKLQLQGTNQVRVLWASQVAMRLLSKEQTQQHVHKRARQLDAEHRQRWAQQRRKTAAD